MSRPVIAVNPKSDLADFVIIIDGKQYGVDEHDLDTDDIKRIAKSPPGNKVYENRHAPSPDRWVEMIEGCRWYFEDGDAFCIVPPVGGAG